MKRCVALGALAALFVWTGVVLAQEAVTIKLKELAEGESVNIDKKETGTFKMKIVDGQGKVLNEKAEEQGATAAYKETILKRDGKKVMKSERAYTKAEVMKGGKAVDLGLAGKTVVIEKKGDQYTFMYKDGMPVKGEAADVLAREFKDKTDESEIERLMMPKGPVKPGDEWKPDVQALAKLFAKDGDMEVDAAKATGTGKLLKVYQKDGKRFGDMQFKIDIPLKAVGKGKEQLTFAGGAKLNMQFNLDACIDGTSDAGMLKMKMDMAGDATNPGAPGFKFVLSSANEAQQTQTEPMKK